MNVLLLATVFFLPLIGATNNFGFEQIKVLFFIVSISLSGLLWLGKHRHLTKLSIISGIFILILGVTSLIGVNPKISLLGADPYFQGWVIYAYLWLFSVLVSYSKVKLDKWAFCLAGSGILISILAIKDWILLNLFNVAVVSYAGRVIVSFGQPNFFAGFLLLTLPFAYYLFKSSNKRSSYFGITSGLIAVVGIFVSYSRSTILMALLLVILGLTDQLKIKFKIGLVVFGIIIASILIALKFSSGIVGNEVSQPILTKNPDLTKESIEKRAYIWPVASKIVQQNFLTGYGLENIGEAFSRYFEKNKHTLFEENLNIAPVLISLKELNIDRSHNYILDLLLFSGILGVLGWLGLLGVLFKKLGQMSHDRGTNVLVVSLITYLVWIQFQNQSIVHLIYFWLLVGLVDQQSS